MIAVSVLVVLICWALERNRRTQIRPPAYGVGDRDLERLVSDLRAIS
jgi:hypothetical protein